MSEVLVKAPVVRCLLFSLLFLLAPGCAVGPDYRVPQPSLPVRWTGTAPSHEPSVVNDQEVDLARWWQHFQDPTLTALIEDALSSNLTLALAEARLRQARAVRGIAAGGLWPSASASAAYQRQSGAPNIDEGAHNLFQAGLDAAWELDFFGGVRRSVESAEASVQAAIEDIRDARVSLVAEVGLDYARLRGFQQETITARNNLEVQRKTADITRRRYKVGFVSGLDVANAESTVAATESQIPVFETGERQSIYALSVLLARQPGDLLKKLSPAGNLPPIPQHIPAGLPSDLLRRRPDIREAEARLHSATAQIGVAMGQLFPQFSLTGAAKWQSSQLDSWWKDASRSLFVGPSASWTFFQGGATISNIHAQEALRDQAFLTYRQTVLTALQDVENALIAFSKEQTHYESLSVAVAADRTAVDLSIRLYQEGQTDFLNVLLAQRSLYSDENAQIQSGQAIVTDLISLYKALGGGWEAPPL